MTVLKVVKVIPVVCGGLIAGIYLDYSASAVARGGLSASSFVQYQQMVHVRYVWMMPVLIVTGILTCLIWLLTVKARPKTPEFWLVAAAVGGLLIIAGVTRAVNAPLNDQLMTWSVAAPPANFREVWAAWERANTMRAAVAVGVLILVSLALILQASNHHLICNHRNQQ
ncbi:MAG TPA: DUF1772 domain-containing protein [Chthoniobacterales bacterium]|nr:DUF1772 domain-containing protein [Chthoniobacterales bacterium]